MIDLYPLHLLIFLYNMILSSHVLGDILQKLNFNLIYIFEYGLQKRRDMMKQKNPTKILLSDW